jgi:hypothetical protein
MVLKLLKIILFLAYFFSNESLLQAQGTIPLSKAYQLATSGNCQETLRILKAHHGLFVKEGKPKETVLELGAVCLEKIGKYKAALSLHYQILNLYHFKAHNLVMQKYDLNQSVDDLEEVPAELAKVYFRMGRVYATFILSLMQLPEKDYEYSLQESKKFLSLSVFAEHEEDAAEKLLQALDKREDDRKKKLFHSSWHATLGYMNWQDEVYLAGPTGRSQLIATTEGPCIGGGFEKANSYWGWKISGCYVMAKSNVGDNIANDFDYYQEGVPVNALSLNPGIFMPLSSGNSSIGLELPVFIRSGSYTDPTDTAFSIEQKTFVSMGIAVDAKWKISQYGLSSKIIKILGLPSVAWVIEGHYHF